MRTMSSRSRLTASGLAAAALAVLLAACGGATVEGEAPEVSSEVAASSAASSTPFAEERPEKPTGPVPPPPPQSPAPEPMPGEPEPPREQDEPEPAEPGTPTEPGTGAAPVPGGGDFAALVERRGVTLPAGMDPVATATEACGRFDRGEQMVDVTGWLGEAGGLDPDQQGFFLGAAVGTYCPENFPKLG